MAAAHAGAAETETKAVGQSLTSCRAATHWLFSHLAGARGVWIPDTALFDHEGVLVAWLSTQPLHQSKQSKTTPRRPARKPEGDMEIRCCEALQLSLLRLEAQFQDLAKCAGSRATVAVLYTDTAALPLDESALDATIRSLCARERRLTAPEPDTSVSRAYPGGCFVLQAAARSSSRLAVRNDAALVIITRLDAASDALSHELQLLQHDDHNHDSAQAVACRERYFAAYVPHIESQCRALLAHLESTARLRVEAMTLAFGCEGRDHVVLTSAHSVQWRLAAAPVDGRQRLPSRGQAPVAVELPATQRAHHVRVCRECRSPVEVDLARELLQSRTLLRGTLAKYQDMSARHADAESRCRQAVKQSQHWLTQSQVLEIEVARLRAELAQQQIRTQEETQRTAIVHTQLLVARQLNENVQQDVAVAHERIHELLQQQNEQLQGVESDATRKIRELTAQELTGRHQIQQLQQEIHDLHVKNRKLQALYEEAQASCDEIEFQWGFVARKLTDVGDSGVLPPKRVAGGFSSYPTPTRQNVAQVVKWLVDYETKRTVLEAQQPKSRHDKTIRKRLRMKVELMRLLAAAQSPIKSASPRRRRSSKSPRKRQPLSPKKAPPTEQRLTAQWAHEQPTLVEQRMRLATRATATRIVDTQPTQTDIAILHTIIPEPSQPD